MDRDSEIKGVTTKEQVLRSEWAKIFSKIVQHHDDCITYLKQHAYALHPIVTFECIEHCPCITLVRRGFEGWGSHTSPWGDGIQMEMIQVESWLLTGCCSCVQQQRQLSFPTTTVEVAINFASVAAIRGTLSVLQCLAELCPSCINTGTTSDNFTPLFAAVSNSRVDVISYLLSQLSAEDVNALSMTRKNSPLMEAVKIRNSDIVEMLLAFPGIDVNSRNILQETPLIHAVRKEDVASIQSLLRAGADVNLADRHGRNALSFAVRTGRKEIVKILLEAGINKDAADDQGETPLLVAIFREDDEVLELLLDAGANPNCVSHDGFPALVAAAYDPNPHLLWQLLEAEADVDITNKQGYSAIHISAWNGHRQNVKVLLQFNAANDVRTTDGNTPLALACHGHNPEVVHLLLSLPCDVNNSDKDGDTPLHYCSWNCDAYSVALLLEKGANPHVRNRLDTTPLWNAVHRGSIDIAKMLLRHNVDLTVRSVGIDQHAQSNNVTECYPTPRSLLWMAAVANAQQKMILLLLIAGYPVWKEDWLRNGVDSVHIEDESLRNLLLYYHSNPPRLLITCRNYFRCLLGSDIHNRVKDMELPTFLKSHLLLTDILGEHDGS